MHPTNTNIVRRTWGLLQSRAQTQDEKNLAYGETFDYDEFMQLPNYIVAAGISLAIFFFALFSATLPPVCFYGVHYQPEKAYPLAIITCASSSGGL